MRRKTLVMRADRTGHVDFDARIEDRESLFAKQRTQESEIQATNVTTIAPLGALATQVSALISSSVEAFLLCQD